MSIELKPIVVTAAAVLVVGAIGTGAWLLINNKADQDVAAANRSANRDTMMVERSQEALSEYEAAIAEEPTVDGRPASPRADAMQRRFCQMSERVDTQPADLAAAYERICSVDSPAEPGVPAVPPVPTP